MRYIIYFLITIIVGCASTRVQTETEVQMLEDARKQDAPIFWEDLRFGYEEYTDGKEISWVWHNISGKTIKYANFEFQYFNRVDDPASCGYGAGDEVEQTGPIKNGSRESRHFVDLCYNTDATCGELESAEITYMSGESVSFSKEELLELNAIDTTDACNKTY